MWHKLLWAGVLGLLSALLTFGLPAPPGGDQGGGTGQSSTSQEEDKGGGTDPNGLTKGGNTDPDG